MATNNAVNLKSSGIVSYDGAGTFSALANPLTVANGGQGNASLTAYAVLCGGTTSTGVVQSIASVGTLGQVLTSNGAALPTFQTSSGAIGYSLFTLNQPRANPADSQTYFIQMFSSILTNTASGNAKSRYYIPRTGTLKACVGQCIVNGTLGSSENSTLAIRLNNTTDTTVTSTLQLTAASNPITNTSLSIAVTAGDYIELKWTTPAWGTNPTTVGFNLTLYLE